MAEGLNAKAAQTKRANSVQERMGLGDMSDGLFPVLRLATTNPISLVDLLLDVRFALVLSAPEKTTRLV